MTIDSGTGVVHQAPAFGEVDYELLLAEQARFVDGEGPPLICCGRPRRQVHRRSPGLPGPLGQGHRQGHHPRAARPRAAVPPGAVPARLSVLLAGRRRSADPVPAAELVHPHHAVQGPDAGQQPPDQLAARTHPRRPVRQLPGDQRRLGPVPRTVLGHAAADLGLRGDRPDGGGRPATPNCWPSRACRASRSGSRPSRPSPQLPDDLQVHKPYIDAVTYDSPFAPGGRMRRVPEVIDCWFDSGAMPFAQWGYPHQGREQFRGPVPGRLHQRGARPDPRLVLQPAGDQHAAVRRRGARPTRPRGRTRSRTPSRTASCWA